MIGCQICPKRRPVGRRRSAKPDRTLHRRQVQTLFGKPGRTRGELLLTLNWLRFGSRKWLPFRRFPWHSAGTRLLGCSRAKAGRAANWSVRHVAQPLQSTARKGPRRASISPSSRTPKRDHCAETARRPVERSPRSGRRRRCPQRSFERSRATRREGFSCWLCS